RHSAGLVQDRTHGAAVSKRCLGDQNLGADSDGTCREAGGSFRCRPFSRVAHVGLCDRGDYSSGWGSVGGLMKIDSEIIEPAEKPTIPERIAEVLVVPLLLGIIAIGFAAVCLRFLFGGRYALFWSEELIRYGFIWLFWIC